MLSAAAAVVAITISSEVVELASAAVVVAVVVAITISSEVVELASAAVVAAVVVAATATTAISVVMAPVVVVVVVVAVVVVARVCRVVAPVAVVVATTATAVKVSAVVALPVVSWSPILAAWPPVLIYSYLWVPPQGGGSSLSILTALLSVPFNSFYKSLLTSFSNNQPFEILFSVLGCQLCVPPVRLVPQLLLAPPLALGHVRDHSDILKLCVK